MTNQESTQKQQEGKSKIDPAIVCPNCADRIGCASVMPGRTDRHGRTIRAYFGWCTNCHRGIEVIQFRSNNKWLISQYRYWLTVTENPGSNVSCEWHELNPLPEVPAVVTGPGGDYDKAMMIKTADTLKSINGILYTLKKTIEGLIKTINLSGK